MKKDTAKKAGKYVLIAAGITALGTIGAAFIGSYFSRPNAAPKLSATQTSVGSISQNAANQEIHAGRDVKQAGGNFYETNNYGDSTNKNRKRNSSVTYNISSNGQKGGITAANVVQFNNATIIVEASTPSDKNLDSDYKCTIDTVLHLIQVQPRIGDWNAPFIGIPSDERTIVNPNVVMKDISPLMVTPHGFQIRDEHLYGVLANMPATSTRYYGLHYETMPSTIVFGNYPDGPLFKIQTK